ncbi:MAG TPA: hypothetical protein VIW64_07235 [Pyrinomonadaceae bacterium]|jgi:hypothetical protein
MEKITDIIAARVFSEDGECLGRVCELRSPGEPEHGEPNATRVVGELVYARRGWLELFGLRKANLRSVEWKSVKKLDRKGIVIKG